MPLQLTQRVEGSPGGPGGPGGAKVEVGEGKVEEGGRVALVAREGGGLPLHREVQLAQR